MKRENLKAELAFLKELFFESLPLGEKADQVQEYFSYLEKAIATKDPDEFNREEFPPDDPSTCGDRVYKYHSAASFKQHASKQQDRPHRLGLGNSQGVQAKLPSTQNTFTETQNLEHLQEREGGRGSLSGGRNPCPDIQGQLDRGHTG